MNKRGMELTVGTLVVIVLAAIVLVVLVVGFTSGWSNLWANISQFFGSGGANIDSVVSACNTACLTGSKDAFCRQTRSVVASSEVFNQEKGKDKDGKDITLPATNKVTGKTCNSLLKEYPTLFPSCAAITCPTG